MTVSSLLVVTALVSMSVPIPLPNPNQISAWFGGRAKSNGTVSVKRLPARGSIEQAIIQWYQDSGYNVIPDPDPPSGVEFSLVVRSQRGSEATILCTKQSPRTFHFERLT